MWKSQFITASLQEEFQENFKKEDASPVVSFSKVCRRDPRQLAGDI